ncbi:MAG: TolC family protein [Bacteroidales bacterium]|nr:TolC family protein [Bacteroidales bacterium]
MARRMTITLLMTLLFGAANAQDTAMMTLRDCVRYALAHSAELRVLQADLGDAQLARRNAILNAFTPSVSGDVYAYSNFGRSIDPETNTYSTTTSFHNGYSLSAGITLFNGFRAVNNLKITKLAESTGVTRIQQSEDRIRLATMEAYCNVLYYTELLKTIQAQTETAETALRLAQRQAELGQKSQANVLQMEADLSDRRYKLTVCENQLQNAYITLKDIMLYPTDQLFSVTDVEVDTTLSDGMLAMEAGRAAERLPAVIIAENERQTARLALKTAKWQLLPSLSLYGGWSSTYFTYPGRAGYVPVPYWRQLSDNGGEYVQLSLSIPIYDRLSRQTEIARRRNDCDRAEARYMQTRQGVEAEVRRALADRDGAAAALRQAERHAALQQQLYAMSTRQFEQGLLSALEYRTVADNHLSSTADLLNARLQLFLKTWVVRYYFGLVNGELRIEN